MSALALALLLFAPPVLAEPPNTELAHVVFRAHDPDHLRAIAAGFVRPTRQKLFTFTTVDVIPDVVFEAIKTHLEARGHSEHWDEMTWASRAERFDLALSSPTRGLVDLGSIDIVVGFFLPTADVHSTSILALERMMHLSRQTLGAYSRMDIAHHAHTCLPFSANCIVRSPIYRWLIVPDDLARLEATATLDAETVFQIARRSGRRVVQLPPLRDGDPVLVEWADGFPRPRRIEFIRGVGLFDSMFSELKQSPSDDLFGGFPWAFDEAGLAKYLDHFKKVAARTDAADGAVEYGRLGVGLIERAMACQKDLLEVEQVATVDQPLLDDVDVGALGPARKRRAGYFDHGRAEERSHR